MIEHKINDKWLEITICRPEKANAISKEMFLQMTHLLQTNTSTGIIINGIGNHFCAGADLQEIAALGSIEEIMLYTETIEIFFATLNRLTVPIIVECFGNICGAGVGICAVADIVTSSENSLFSCPEVKSSLTPAIIAPYLIKKIGHGHAREWFITGRKHNAKEAIACGLVNCIKGEFDYRNLFSSLDPEATAKIKKMLIVEDYGATGLLNAIKSR